jgi:uncharacterized protein YqgC (DUF456 family)
MTVFVLLWVVGVLLMVAGLAGLLLPAMPGAPLIFLGVLAVAWADGFARIGAPGLIALGLLTALISAVDYAAGLVGARRFGASRWGVLGAFLGLVLAFPLGLTGFGLVGLAIGPVVGALLLEYLKDPDFDRAAQVGLGTLLGFVVGTALKYALAFFLIGLAVVLYIF